MGILSWLFGRGSAGTKPSLPVKIMGVPGISGRPIDFYPLAVKAIRCFGGVRPEKAAWLAGAVAKHLNQGRIAEKVAKDGTLLADDERAELGLPKSPRISRETFDALTPEARTAPLASLEILVGRIAGWAYDEDRRRSDADGMDIGWRRVIRAPRGCCKEAAALRRRKFPMGKTPALPLDACRVGDCQCRWELDRGPRK